MHPLNHDFQCDSIADFLRDLKNKNIPTREYWTVALLSSGDAGLINLASLHDRTINAQRRRIRVNDKLSSILVSGKSSRVGSRQDVLHGLSDDEFRVAVAEAKNNTSDENVRVSEDQFRAAMKSPLIVMYLLRGQEQKDGSYYRDDLILPALALHFPGSSDPDAPRRLVRYRLNKVAQDELFAPDIDDEIELDEDGDD